tara:strand:- start:136 stop:417 length:282 start_codon:yes stop_codon:yes gene_type:complete
MKEITDEKLEKYFAITKEAFEMAKGSKDKLNMPEARADFLDMIERYIKDAKHFEEQGNKVNAFAALNYAHGWLDAGARIGMFDVHDSRLFTVN